MRFSDHPLRGELRAIYSEVDRLLAPFSCAASTECCRFGVTGREPYPTAIEAAEITHALRAQPMPRRASPELDGERPCPLLTAQGKCSVYAARPFGCRTYFCARVVGPGKLPRAALQRLGRAVLALSERYAPGNPGARPLSRVLS